VLKPIVAKIATDCRCNGYPCQPNALNHVSRHILLETADKVLAIEIPKIVIDQVLKVSIFQYHFYRKTGEIALI